MGRIERPPGWILKYKERIENGTITVEGILKEESKIREVPIKISSVTRAINAMGYPITGLRSDKNKEGQETSETGEESKGIENGPSWLQKYRERIENGTITVEGILEEESKIREVPIKLATVKRAVNAMGYPITGMQSGEKKEGEDTGETGEGSRGMEKGPGWLQKYQERIEKGTITVDEILEEENKIRTVPIKRSSVTRAVNAMGYPIIGMRSGRKEVEKEVEKPKKAGEAKTVAYSSSIGKISEETAKKFNAMKKSWEADLDKPLHNDYFLNILLVLAELAGHGKTLTPVKK